MTRPSMLDVATFNGVDASALIEEVLTEFPELSMIGWNTFAGQQYPTIVRTADPTAAFRDVNNGPTPTKSTFEPRLVEAFLLNPRWECDKALADIHPKGAPYYIGLEASAILRAAFRTIASQVYYGTGTGGDAKGFPGLLAAYDTTNMEVDATGTTDTTCSSVWMIKRGEQDVEMQLGANGVLEVPEVRIGDIVGQNSASLTGYIQDMTSWVGMRVANKWSVGRIKKLTAESGKGLTDTLLSQLLEKFPAGHMPDLILMSRRSRGQLQRSRTTYSPTGNPAPLPSEYEGIPIQITEAILNTEALAL